MNHNHQTNLDQLQDLIATLAAETQVPGICVGIFHNGETFTATHGVTNIDHPLPVNDETLFQIGSITKTFTATLIMRLVEQGKLDLDTTVQSYIPGFRVHDETISDQVTIRHLLTHIAGWTGDFFIDTGEGDDALSKYVTEMAELTQLAPLGTVWSYNNASFYLAGHVIETVTGQTYREVLQSLVLTPMGIDHAYLTMADVMTHRFAVGHSVGEEGAKVARPWPLPRAAQAAGGLICDIHNLLRYGRFYLNNGGAQDGTALLTPESMTTLQTTQVPIESGPYTGIGLSWFMGQASGAKYITHSGGTVGQISLLIIVPEHNFIVGILTNANKGGRVTRQISRWVLKTYLDLTIADPEPIEATEAELTPYVGLYSRPFADIALSLQNGKLIAQMTPKAGFPTRDTQPAPAPPPMALALTSADNLVVLDGPLQDTEIQIVRQSSGDIGWIRFGSRIHRRVS